MSPADNHPQLMNKVYRFQRYIYDYSRAFFLLDRDTLLKQLRFSPGESILEIGCGTARNLIWLARHHPHLSLYGIDASSEMLKSARRSVSQSGLNGRIVLRECCAEELRSECFPGKEQGIDTVIFSYSLSMIREPRAALQAALDVLRPGGRICVVDFGDQARLPQWWRSGLSKFLSRFHVACKADQLALLEELGGSLAGRLTVQSKRRGFSYIAHFEKAIPSLSLPERQVALP